jgi:hypothetical protein
VGGPAPFEDRPVPFSVLQFRVTDKPSQDFVKFVSGLVGDIWRNIGGDQPVIERDGAHWQLVEFRIDGTTRLLDFGSYN